MNEDSLVHVWKRNIRCKIKVGSEQISICEQTQERCGLPSAN